MLQNGEKPIPGVWRNYFAYLYEGVNSSFSFDGTEVVLVDQNELWYLPKIIYYLLKLPDEHIELYMWWATLYAMIINTTSEMIEYISKQTAPFISNTITRSRCQRFFENQTCLTNKNVKRFQIVRMCGFGH